MQARAMRKSLAAMYAPPAIKSYTDACEAPVAMWNGAIPLKQVRSGRGPNSGRVVQKLYSHPPEVAPPLLGFNDINSMYCIGDEELRRYFPEGLGGRVSQLMPPGHPRGFLYRRQSHLLNVFVDKLPFWRSKQNVLTTLTGGRPGLLLDGPTGSGKSALLCQAVHFARARGVLTLYVPAARAWTHGEWCWPSTLLPGFFDAPDAARAFLRFFLQSNAAALAAWKLRVTPGDLPTDQGERPPTTLAELCQWGWATEAPAAVDRQSVAIKFLMDELAAETEHPLLFVVDGWNLFAGSTHFRYPHPDFLRSLTALNEITTDADLYPQELPRIPAARLTFVRGLNRLVLGKDAGDAQHQNKFFIAGTTRDFKPFDGVSGFARPDDDRHANSLDEYAPFDPQRDTHLHVMPVSDMDDYEYRAFLRFTVNSGELAGLGWGPMWHYSSSFERKLYKIDFLSGRNPQRVVDHYHQELVWRAEYQRTRQKQFLLNRRQRWGAALGMGSGGSNGDAARGRRSASAPTQ